MSSLAIAHALNGELMGDQLFPRQAQLGWVKSLLNVSQLSR